MARRNLPKVMGSRTLCLKEVGLELQFSAPTGFVFICGYHSPRADEPSDLKKERRSKEGKRGGERKGEGKNQNHTPLSCHGQGFCAVSLKRETYSV